MENNINIVEAYIKFKGQLVILISGISGTGKKELANHLSRVLKIGYINTLKFYKKDYNTKIKLPSGEEVINWDSDDAVDWKELHKEIDSQKSKGVVVSGEAFQKKNMTVPIDFHLHIKKKKQDIIQHRKDFLEKHKNEPEFQKEYKFMQDSSWIWKFNQITYPYYLKSVENSVINKFLNSSEMTNDKIYDEAFDYLMNSISKYLYKDMKRLQQQQARQKKIEVLMTGFAPTDTDEEPLPIIDIDIENESYENGSISESDDFIKE